MNIDKDIERVKSIVKVHNDFLKGCNDQKISENEIHAIENVLKELEKKDIEISRLKDELDYDHKEYKRMSRDTKKELETYKKMAEKLAEYITITDINEDVICDSVPEEICEQRAIGDCKQCIIDWARKEVENEN